MIDNQKSTSSTHGTETYRGSMVSIYAMLLVVGFSTGWVGAGICAVGAAVITVL